MLAIALLAGCNPLEYRHGPKPIIDAASVEAASVNKLALLRALARDASIGAERPEDWYLVAEAGFNYIDDQCRAYFDELFFLDRRAERIKTGLATGAQTTAAILAVTGASSATMNIVAQAFGFSVHATDLIAGTYLYRLPPATTQGFVTKLQLAFRDGAAANRGLISTPTSAYHVIQRYLDLCLPPRIEAEIAKQISATTAVGVPRGEGALFSLETVSTPPESAMRPPVLQPVVRTRIIERAGDQLAKRTPPSQDQRIERERIFMTQLQASLCVPQPTGTFNADTDRAIRDFLRGRERRVPTTLNLNEATLRTQLQGAIDDLPNCRSAGFANAYEVAKFGPKDGVEQTIEIQNLQARLATALRNKPSQLTVSVTGRFDEQTRKGIQELRGTTNQIDQAFNNELLLIRVRPAPPTNGAAPGTPAPPPNATKQ